jgi:hypothetical protein
MLEKRKYAFLELYEGRCSLHAEVHVGSSEAKAILSDVSQFYI